MIWLRLALITALVVMASSAPAQFTTLGAGGIGGAGVPSVPCTAGQIDLSLSTGCNLPFYLNGVFP